jgi:hypothetical protein
MYVYEEGDPYNNKPGSMTFQPEYGVSLEDAAQQAIEFEKKELLHRFANGLPYQASRFDFHGIVQLVHGGSTAEALVKHIRSIQDERAMLYANAPVPENAREQVQSGGLGDRLHESVVSGVQCAQRWGNSVYRRDPSKIGMLRHVFEWNGVKVPFNPWANGESTRLGDAVIKALEDAREAYLNSDEYREREAQRAAEIATMQAKLPQLMAELPAKLKSSLSELLSWVTEFSTYHDRNGVETDPDAVVSLFKEHGFEPNAFVGPEFKEALRKKDNRTRYLIGQFLNILPMRQGMPPVLWSMAEDVQQMPDTVAA